MDISRRKLFGLAGVAAVAPVMKDLPAVASPALEGEVIPPTFNVVASCLSPPVGQMKEVMRILMEKGLIRPATEADIAADRDYDSSGDED